MARWIINIKTAVDTPAAPAWDVLDAKLSRLDEGPFTMIS